MNRIRDEPCAWPRLWVLATPSGHRDRHGTPPQRTAAGRGATERHPKGMRGVSIPNGEKVDTRHTVTLAIDETVVNG